MSVYSYKDFRDVLRGFNSFHMGRVGWLVENLSVRLSGTPRGITIFLVVYYFNI